MTGGSKMSNQWHGGKGSKQRPVRDRKTFDDNWDKIFAPKPKKDKDNDKTKNSIM